MLDSTPTIRARPKRLFVALCLVALGAGALLHARFGFYSYMPAGHAWGIDDAYITLRYAQNLAAGAGPVFNPGERVEGYTAPLHVLLMAPVVLATTEHAYDVSCVVNLLCSSLALVVLYRRAREELDEPGAMRCTLLFALSPVVWLWTTAGLETPLVVLLQLLAWAALPRGTERESAWPLIAALATLAVARADGFVTGAAVVAYLLLAGRRQLAVRCGAAVALVFAITCAWRLAYYGYPLPNTYYAKVAGTLADRLPFAGGELLLTLVVSGLVPHVGALLADAAGSWRRRIARPEAVLALVLLAYYLYVGGDYFRERFLLVLMPLGAFSALRAVQPRGRAATGRTFALLLFVQVAMPFLLDPRFDYRIEKYDAYATTGRFLGERFPGALLATDAAGKIPYYSKLRTIDMLGLNDEHIGHLPSSFSVPGHSKYDAEYVLGREPDVIVGPLAPDWGGSLKYGLARDRYLAAGYEIRYLVNTSTRSKPENVVALSGTDAAVLREYAERGYTYAVLTRIEPSKARNAAGAKTGERVLTN